MLGYYKHNRFNMATEEMKNLKYPTEVMKAPNDDNNLEFVEGCDEGFYQSFDELETDFDEMKDYDIVYKNGKGGMYVDGEIKRWEGRIGQSNASIHQTFDEFGKVIDEHNGEIIGYRAYPCNSYTQKSNIKVEFGDILVLMNLMVGSRNFDVRQFTIDVFFDDSFETENLLNEAKKAGFSKSLEEDSPIDDADLQKNYDYVMPLKFISNVNFSEAFGSDEDDEVDWHLLEDASTYYEDIKEEVEQARKNENKDELVKKYNEEGVKREDIRPHIDEIRESLVDEYRKTINFVDRIKD